MKYILTLGLLFLLMTSCTNELIFEEQSFQKKTALPCQKDCPHINVKLPIAKNVPIVADSINKKVFSVMKEIIYVGEKPYTSTDYEGLLTAFIDSYEQMQRENPKDVFGWEGEIEGRVLYQTDSILNIEIKHYTYTGGAHGYTGRRSLIFDPATGKSIADEYLFRDIAAFRKFAEQKFRAAYQLTAEEPINAKGLMFEEDRFQLPQTYFFTDDGFLLYYNVYEIASYADGPKELLIPYDEMKPYLITK